MKALGIEGRRFLGHLGVGIAFVVLAWRMPQNLLVESALAGYAVILADSFLCRRCPHERERNFRIAALLFLVPVIIMPMASTLEELARPTTLDAALRAADLRLHLDGFALTRFCLAHGWARWVMGTVYGVLPVAVALAWVAGRSWRFLRGALWGAVGAFVVQVLVPAVGPQYAFAGWPWPGAQVSAPGLIGHPRNCMPSMHFAWAALAAFNVPRRWRPLFWLYAGLMALATVACGEHYAVDVLVAVPYAMAVQWAAEQWKGLKLQDVVLSWRRLGA